MQKQEGELEALRDLLNDSQIGLPDYLTDAATQRRVGALLAEVSARAYPTTFHSMERAAVRYSRPPGEIHFLASSSHNSMVSKGKRQ